MTTPAELCELAIRQVPKYICRSNDNYPARLISAPGRGLPSGRLARKLTLGELLGQQQPLTGGRVELVLPARSCHCLLGGLRRQ